MADIKESFELYDETGDGFISVKDAANVVRSFGFNPTEHELNVGGVCVWEFLCRFGVGGGTHVFS